ncbi:inhibitor of Bruton tyrosine kinase isoform X1 [Dendroctonus ponderosae]|nr:inhibitor of Bruton tyrosine kinase isoform X1 [Dendroctonus ponderosae]XP_048517913.1 inhibitor of Bruton tyrosine kinase isoform X1 [Dendroctonus ponderosae]
MMNKQSAILPDCTNRCQSTQHGDIVTAAISKRSVSDSNLASFLNTTCCCCESVKDQDGRTALHVAASCGRTALVRWLVLNRHANINAPDKESGYTALHRSAFYGKIDTVVELIKLGANVAVLDGNSLTYLEHAMLDRFRPPNNDSKGGELFSWGPNSNNSLGSQHSRTVPETMDIFHKEYPDENVRLILIQEFHSVILTTSGLVFTCGHGQGGRLGLGVQHTEFLPKPIKFPTVTKNVQTTFDKIEIVNVSIARDHSLFLSSCGEIFACGLNKHMVLGMVPPPAELLTPKLVKYSPNGNVSLATGNYHSIVWGASGIFTWGLNAGQLGHPAPGPSEKYILTAKRVKYIAKENSIRLVCASTGATVVYTVKGDVYILHEYQCRKIASRQLNLVEIAVVGGNLNHSLDPELSNKNRELRVAALTSTGNLLLWQESDAALRKCIFSIGRKLTITQVVLNMSKVLFVTRDGEAFQGEARPRKKKPTGPKEKGNKSDFHKFFDRDESLTVKVEKIARVHRALSIQSDPKGQNFGIVQDRPYSFFPKSEISASTMPDNLLDFLLQADVDDGIADVEINISGRLFPAHRYILASRSPYFSNLFAQAGNQSLEYPGYNPVIFEEFLRYVYTGTTELIRIGELKNPALIQLCSRPVIVDENAPAFQYYSDLKVNRKLNNPVRMLHEMAKRFEVMELQKILSNLEVIRQEVTVKKGGRDPWKTQIHFNRFECPELWDVEIHCKDDRVLKGHKCILVARLDYFNNMFSTRWSGAETSKISIHFAKGVVESLLAFLYTDSLDSLDEKDIDQLFKIIVLADQFFVKRLKDQCEAILSNLLTVKNAVELLTFADSYNACSLKENCFQFVQQNVTSFLEMRLLDDLEPQLLAELSQFYQQQRRLDCRIITPYSTAVCDEEVILASALCAVDLADIQERSAIKEKRKPKKRIPSHKVSASGKVGLEHELLTPTVSVCDEPKLDSPPVVNSRVLSIVLANELVKTEAAEENFTVLRKHRDSDSWSASFDFPLLNSPPKSNAAYSRPQKTEPRVKTSKLSQKQRKRLSSESSSPPVAEAPKNPWKVIESPVSPVGSPQNDDIGSIISNERKQKENLEKIRSKRLVFTQMEDKAIEELRRFYSVDDMDDEIIVINRVSMGAVALPTWVPKTK